MNYFKLKNPDRDDPDRTFDSATDEDGWIKFTFSDDEDKGSDYYIDEPEVVEFDKVVIKINDVVYGELSDEFMKAFADALLWHKLKAKPKTD